MERTRKVHEIKRPCADFGKFRPVSRRRVPLARMSSLDTFGDIVRAVFLYNVDSFPKRLN